MNNKIRFGRRVVFAFFICLLFLPGTGCRQSSPRDIVAAVRQGNVPAIAEFLRKDPGLIRAKNRDGDPLVIIAASHGHMGVIRYLFEHGVGKQRYLHGTALITAAAIYNPRFHASDRAKTVSALRAMGFREDFRSAAAIGDISTMRRLAKEYPGVVDKRYKDDDSMPLFWALYGGQRAVKWLVRHGANINALVSPPGVNTALEYAILLRQFRMARLLVRLGANVNVVNRNGTNALTEAYHVDSRRMVDFLKKHGAR